MPGKPCLSRAALAKLFSLLVVLPLAPLAGCLRAELRPTVPMGSRSDDIETSVMGLRVGLDREFAVRMRTPTGHRIARTFLTVPSRRPCQGGLEPTTITVDGRPSVVVAAGEHELRARFAPDGFAMDLALDFELDDGRCVRTAAFSTSLPFEAQARPVLALSMPLRGNAGVRGLAGVFAGQLGMATWMGGVRLLAEAGIGSAFCEFETCGKGDSGSRRSGLAVPVGLELSYPAARWDVALGASFLLLGLRYDYAYVRLPTLAGRDAFGVHGLHAQLGWAITERLKGNLRRLERAAGLELVLPVGVLVAPAGKVAFSAGMTVRFLLPL